MGRTKSTPAPSGQPQTQLAAKKAAKRQVKMTASSSEGGDVVVAKKAARRHKPGVVALLKIERERKSTKAGLRRGSFVRLAKELAPQLVKMTDEAKSLVQRIVEQALVDTYRGAYQLAAHRDAPMLTARDVAQYEALAGSSEVAARIREELLEPRQLLLKCQERSQKAARRKERKESEASTAD